MPTTPTFALPYPSPGAAADVPYDIQQLAERVEEVQAGLDGGWLNGASKFTAAAGWSITGSQYRQYGPYISAQVNMTRTGANIGAGNIVNTPMVSLDATVTPAMSNGMLGSGPSGSMIQGYASTGGTLTLTNTAFAINTGQAVNLMAVWMV